MSMRDYLLKKAAENADDPRWQQFKTEIENMPVKEHNDPYTKLSEGFNQLTEPLAETTITTVKEAVEQGLKEANQPIWERESTVKILGEDGADKLQDTLNPARWGENAIDNLGIPDTAKDNLKKYLPVALAGGAALLLLSALK